MRTNTVCPLLSHHSGFEIARQLGAHGAKLMLMGRRAQPLAAAVEVLQKEGIDCAGVTGDVRKLEGTAVNAGSNR